MADKSTRLAVIGAGPGGYAAAFMAADLGVGVTLIDPAENPGGVCLYHGCIPSKALLHAARLIEETREAGRWGLSFSGLKVERDHLRRWKNEVVAGLTGGLGQLVKRRNITYLRTTARFQDNHTLVLGPEDGPRETLSFENAVIATGSLAASLRGLDFASDRIFDSTRALDLADIPGRFLIVGGGYIGLEMGTVYAALGARVTVVEMTSDLLPGVDRDLVRFLQKRLQERFEGVLLQTTVAEIKEQKNGLRVTLEDAKEGVKTRIFDAALTAVGRRPNTADLGLENTRIDTDDRGFIQVDPQRRTREPHIFAIGDVAGEPMLAHKASHEGRVAAEVIAGRPVAFEPSAIPAVVFTDPEIAWVGLSETDAKKSGVRHAVIRYPWTASGRAATLARSDGLTKLIIEPESERILGMGLTGVGAGEMIAEGVLAIEMGANVTDLALSIHPHPTLSETVMEAADLFHGTATHYYRPKRRGA
jgi:dihydrolipoamide dehydrogenase